MRRFMLGELVLVLLLVLLVLLLKLLLCLLLISKQASYLTKETKLTICTPISSAIPTPAYSPGICSRCSISAATRIESIALKITA